jgi:hypothetical protein
LQAGDDADTAQWYKIKDLIGKEDLFAFDHYEVLIGVVKSQSKFESIKNLV